MRRAGWKQVRGKWQPVILEEHVLEEIVARLWYQAKIKVWRVRERIPGVGALSTPGIPDLIGWVPATLILPNAEGGIDVTFSPIHRPVPLFIEVKRPGGVHRPAQESWIADARADGCFAFFAESWDDVRKEMAQHGIQLQA